MILSVDYANNYLNFLLGKTKTLTAPTQVWLGLCTNDCEAEGTFSEVSGNGYGRTLLSYSGQTLDVTISAAAARALENLKQIVTPKATGDYTVKGIGLFSAETGGTPFAWGNLDTENGVAVVTGALPMFEKGAFGLYMPDGTE